MSIRNCSFGSDFCKKITRDVTVSCGCKNEENKVSLLTLDRGLVDGTMKCGIKKTGSSIKTIPQEFEEFILIKIEVYG